MNKFYKELYNAIEQNDKETYYRLVEELLVLGYIPVVSLFGDIELKFLGPLPRVNRSYFDAVFSFISSKIIDNVEAAKTSYSIPTP